MIKNTFTAVILCTLGSAIHASPTTQPAARADGITPRSEACFGLHLDLHPNAGDKALGADVTEEHVAHVLDRIRPDFVQYDSKGHPGLLGFPSKIGPSAAGIVNDSLAVWRKITRERGIGLYVHFSGLFDSSAVAAHPDWAAVDAAGKPNTRSASVFGPYVDQLMIPQLSEVVTNYALDGAWVDGECWAAALDYSPAALAKWKEETQEAQAPKSRKDPHWAEWKAFQRKHFESYVGHWVDALHAVNPKLQLTSNWLYTTLTPQPVRAKIDFVSGDYDPSMSVDRARVEARYLATTGMPWDLMAWGFLNGHDGFNYNLKSATHLQQEAGAVLMQGGGMQVYYQPTRSGYLCDSICAVAGEVAEFCHARKQACQHSTSVPQVALVFSTAAVLDRSDAVGSTGGTYSEMTGTLHALLECHYSVDILPEFRLKDRLAEFPLVVLPDFDHFDPQLIEALPAYVRSGGKLLLMGPRCARLCQAMLGVKLEGEPKAASVELANAAGGMVNADGNWQKVSLDGAKAIAHRYPLRDTRKDGEIAATLNLVGQGRVAAIWGPAGVYFLLQHNPSLRGFIGDVIHAVYPYPAVTVTGPACVDIALRRTAAGEPALHFLNRANVPTSPHYELIDYIPPAGPMVVEWKLPTRPRELELVPRGIHPEWTWSQGVLKTTVPSIEVHDILVVR